jgi:hypothetical protein
MEISYNPQQNGFVERMNRSIIGSSRDMIHEQELPMFMWEEACNMMIYVHNKSPHRILEEKYLKEVFSMVKPKIGHLRIFGCTIYIHVHVENMMKMERSIHKGIFVVYIETSKAYVILIPAQQKTILSRDVKFNENVASRSTQGSSTMIEDIEKQAPKDEK